MDKHLKMLDGDMRNPGVIKSDFVTQILASRDSIAAEMCAATGTANFGDIRSDQLNKRNISKEKVCQWLETICCLVDSYCSPVLKSASELSSEVSKLKDDKISDATKIIELQEKLITKQEKDLKKIVDLQEKLLEKKDGDLGMVKSIFEKEMKSYSSFFKNTCNNVFTASKIKAVVRTVTEEEDRNKNLILHGVDDNEVENEQLEVGVRAVLDHLNEKPAILNCCRVGTGERRPIKITLNSSEMVRQILSKTKLLRDVSSYDEIYLCPDRTFAERAAHRRLVGALKKKREDEPGKVHFIRNDRIVTRDKRAEE